MKQDVVVRGHHILYRLNKVFPTRLVIVTFDDHGFKVIAT